ncbi:MAG: aryl-sulfate sulfotransferase, partial [Deltaproteobacteria bacterium]|nr:aryl-sulfate sulfotransferase [Deltaproteobacteria bacterium]
ETTAPDTETTAPDTETTAPDTETTAPDTESTSGMPSDDTSSPQVVELTELTVVPNPYHRAPLTAIVSAFHENLSPEDVTQIHITIAGKDGASDLSAELTPSSPSFLGHFDMSDIVDTANVGIPVLGLYPDYNNVVNFQIQTATMQFKGTVTIPVAPIAELENEVVTISVADREKMAPGWTFLNGRVYDHDGNCRWLGPNIFRIRSDGNIIGRTDDYNWLGRLLVKRTLPSHLSSHHDNIELPNGNAIICTTNENNRIVNYNGDDIHSPQDGAVELDKATGEVVNAWDMRAFLDVNRATYILQQGDWFHLNTLCYDDFDDSLIMSGRHQGIVAVTRGGIQGSEPNAGKTLKWILAPHMDWNESGFDGLGERNPADYLLTAVDEDGVPYDDDVQNNLAPPSPNADDFFWPAGQHGLEITYRTNKIIRLMTFNNQASYIFDGSGTIDNGAWFGRVSDRSNDRDETPFSQIIEYEIDEEAMTVKKIWSYGEHDPELYGSYQSTVEYFPVNDNRLLYSTGVSMVNTANNPRNPTAVEVTADGTVVFYLEIENTSLLAYRAGRIDMFHPAVE